MGKKVSITDLYKIEKTVIIEDKDTDKEADVLLRIISDNSKEEVIRYANEKKVELANKLKDKSSVERISLEEMVVNAPINTLELKLDLLKQQLIQNEVYLELRLNDKYKDLMDSEIEDNEEFNKDYTELKKKRAEEYLASLDKSEDNLRRELRDLNIKVMLNSFHTHSFNEMTLAHAIRNPEDPSKRLFNSVAEMKDNIFGDTYMQLIDKYYSLRGNMSENDVKN